MKAPKDQEIETLLEELKDIPGRDPHARLRGKAQFLAQAQEIAPNVSPQKNRRHTEWFKNHFERMMSNMRTPLKPIAWMSITLLAVVAVFLATNTHPVSAQQILERASEVQARAKTVSGILHTRIRIFKNPGIAEGEGNTSIIEDYLSEASGEYRSETRDENGVLVSVSAADGKYFYYAPVVDDSQPLAIERTPIEKKQPNLENADQQAEEKPAPSERKDVETATHAAFDQFYNNPRVEVEDEQIWSDGSPVYVLVNRSYQTQRTSKGQNDGPLTGTTRMVFNKNTYQLLQIETTVHIDDEDILIYKVDFLLSETLPSGSHIAWDLSDLKNTRFVDVESPAEREVITDKLTRQELARHTQAYVLQPIPDGFTEEILANDYQLDADYDNYEINYRNAEGTTFNLQSVGLLEPNFVEENFYDGSYKTASGLIIYFSPSSSENATSAMLAAPDGNGFLLMANMPRKEVTDLAEKLVLAR